MSWQATSWAQNQKTGSPSGKAVLLVLANYANEYGVCWPAQNTLALATEQSPDSVQRRLKELEKRNLIKKRKRKRNDGRWPITEYELQMTEQKIDHAADCGSDSETSNSPSPPNGQSVPQDKRSPNRTAVRQELSLNPTLEYSFGGHESRGHPSAVGLANAIEKQLGTAVYRSWFKGVRLIEAFDSTVTISVPKKFNTDYIRSHFSDVILSCARTLFDDAALRRLNVVTCRS
jgi:hypothetical protein